MTPGWLRRPAGRWHLLRSLASLAIAFFCVEFLWLLDTLALRPDAVPGAVACLAGPGAIVLNLVILAASILHAVTWFPKRSSWVGMWVVASGIVVWWAVR